MADNTEKITLSQKEQKKIKDLLNNTATGIQNQDDYNVYQKILNKINNIKSNTKAIEFTGQSGPIGSGWIKRTIIELLGNNSKYKIKVTPTSAQIPTPKVEASPTIAPNAPAEGEVIKKIEKQFLNNLFTLKNEKPYFRKSYSVL